MLNFIAFALIAATLLAIVPAAHADETTIASGMQFPEGPSLSADGKTLYAVNVQTANISKLDIASGNFQQTWVVLPGTGKGNGSTMGLDGKLYVCDVGRKLICSISQSTGDVETVVDHDPTGNPLLGPNDIVFAKDGSLYFTDPNGSSLEKPIGSVYRYDLKSAQISLVASGLAYPNGLALTRDGKTLYVAETPRGDIDAFDISPNPVDPATNKRVFAHVGDKVGADGMRMSHDGFLYAAIYGAGKIDKLDPNGSLVKTYLLSSGPNVTNIELDEKHHRMFITYPSINSIVALAL